MTKLNEVWRSTEKKAPAITRLFSSPRSVVIFSLLAFSAVLVRDAWLHEDAFITLRTIDNFVSGYGLRYNISQRVQTFTHPLWMFLLTIPYALTREPLFTSLFVSIVVSLISLFLLLRYLAPSTTTKIILLVILISSRSFIDYSTAGLENPLSHLLLIVFLILYFNEMDSRRNLFFLSLLAAFAGVNRLDTLLFFLPPLLIYFVRIPSFTAIVLGFLPLLGWVMFSLIYYGFPLPNSAYAKLNIHVPAGDLYRQGMHYFQDLVWRDPLSSLTILAGLVTGFLERKRKEMAVTAGVILYLLYILRIGGDYMSGRFFTAPLIVAVVLLIRSRWLNELSRFQAALLVTVALLLGLISAHPVLLPIEYERRWRDDNGITDERQYYEAHTGLSQNLVPDPPLEKHWLADNGLRAKEEGQDLLIKGGIGLAGYFAGPDVHIVDNYALADSLLSHLPVGNPDFWRIGHFNRKRPAGFEESLISGENELEDADLAAYYDKLLLVITGPLFDPNRLLAIWQLNTGQYDHFIDADRYVSQQMIPVQEANVNTPLQNGTMLDAKGIVTIPYQGISIKFENLKRGSTIELSIDENYAYRLIFLRDGVVLDDLLSHPGSNYDDALRTRFLPIPDEIRDGGFDEVHIRPYMRGMDGKNARGLGYLFVNEES
jgi:arabinofuranosyltransferase